MNRFTTLVLAGLLSWNCLQAETADAGWISLFNGKDLTGWKASENQATFSVKDGAIVAAGPRSHLFYVGEVNGASFKNFEFKADLMTKPRSNSGIYFHTQFQKNGWPRKGYEAQVNNTQGDPRKTGSLYAVKDVKKAPAKDNEWFHYHIIVNGKTITLKIDGETTVEFTETEDSPHLKRTKGRKLSGGTFALQGHDPKSVVMYKNIFVKPLPDDEGGK